MGKNIKVGEEEFNADVSNIYGVYVKLCWIYLMYCFNIAVIWKLH